MNWKFTQTITGSPAEGRVYLKRENITEEFWRKIDCGEHILFTAPRRVGKSSIMKDIASTKRKNYVIIYNDIEGDRSQKDFFKRLFTILLSHLNPHRKLLTRAKHWISTKKIGEFSVDGFQIIHEELNYKEALLELLQELGNVDAKIIFLLDEFPDVINAIHKNEGKEKAADTLQTLREIRQDGRFKKVHFVFAGSVGIEHIVEDVERLKLINDLKKIPVESLTVEEGKMLISQLIDGASIQVNDLEMDYLLKKINFLLPYYIQLMVERCDKILHKSNTSLLSSDCINQAFNQIILEGSYFGDWEDRLKSYLDPADMIFCCGVLTRCAHEEPYPIQKIYDYSKIAIPQAHYKSLMDDVLIKDGYLITENNTYRFLSPFLREWWKNRHPKFEIET